MKERYNDFDYRNYDLKSKNSLHWFKICTLLKFDIFLLNYLAYSTWLFFLYVVRLCWYYECNWILSYEDRKIQVILDAPRITIIQNIIWQIDLYIDDKAILRYSEHNMCLNK